MMRTRRPLALRRTLPATLALLVTLSPAAVAAGEAGTADSSPSAGVPVLWLDGPFGRVAADTDRAADTPSSIPLDAWVLGAPLVLDTGDPGVTMRAVTITSLDDAGVRSDLARDTAIPDRPLVALEGPREPGDYRLEATVRTSDGRTLTGGWSISVPDRPYPDDGVLDIPAPVALLSTTLGEAPGAPGHGCYIYLCVEIGELPPARALEPVRAASGDVLELRLSDGSGFRVEAATIRPADGRVGPTELDLTAGSAMADSFELGAPPTGDWLVCVEIVYDRQRGFSETLFRVVSE